MRRLVLDSLRSCHNSSDWVRGAISGVEHSANGMDSWAPGTAAVCICDVLYVFLAGGLLPPP